MDKSKVREVLRRWKTAQSNRSVWHNTWEDLARVLLPQRQGFVSQAVNGQPMGTDLYDGTPMVARRGLANAVGGILRPASGFVQLTAANAALQESDEAAHWLDDTNERLRAEIYAPAARLAQATGEVDDDLVTFGTGVLFVGERRGLNGLLFQSVHLKDGYVSFDDEGKPSMMFRSRTFTLRQAEVKFGRERLGEKAREKLKQNAFDDKEEYVHVVMPRAEGDAFAILASRLPYAALWIEVTSETVVQEGGYHEFPYIVPRWDTSSGEDYGRSPGMIALPDANSLQAMGYTILKAGHRAAAPPMAVPDDGAFQAINTYPDGLAYYNPETAAMLGKIPIQPLETGIHLPITRDMQNDLRQQVLGAFFKNVFNLPVYGQPMTATEIIQRREEFIREVGPVFGRLETDYTAPMVERAFKILFRAGRFLPVPEVLAGEGIRFEYESPIRRMRQQIEAAAAQAIVAEMTQYVQLTGDREALDNVDIDAYVRFKAQATDAPLRIFRSQEQIQALRAQRAQREQEAHMAQIAQQAAQAAKTAGETPGMRQLLENAGNGGQPAQPAQAA